MDRTFKIILIIGALLTVGVVGAAFYIDGKRPKSTLYAAIEKDDVATVKLHLAAGTDLNTPEGEPGLRVLPLVKAIHAGRDELAKLLMDAGAQINVTCPVSKWSPLEMAIHQGNVEMVRELIRRGADVRAKNKSGQTPLHIAAMDCPEAIEVLMDHGAQPDLNAQANDGATPLRLAAVKGQIASVAKLLAYGADAAVKNRNGETALHRAATESPEAVAMLIKCGAPVSGTDQRGWTPLHHALEADAWEAAQALLEGKADVTIADAEGNVPLHLAAALCPRAIAPLIARGAEVNVRNKTGATPLHLAAAAGNVQAVTELLKKMADPKLADAKGRTALAMARLRKHAEVITLLEAVTPMGVTPMTVPPTTP